MLEHLELYALRNNYNAILFKDGGQFVKIEEMYDGI